MANVIKTVLTYQLDGSTRDFNIPFEYLARKFVVVTLIGVDRKVLTLNTDYRFATRNTISLTKAWGPADGYTTIELRRVTSTTDRLVDFTDGSILRAYDLNVAQVQTMHVAEEARNMTADTIGVNNDGHLDARGRRIVNLANAIDDRDAVPLGQLKTMNQNSWQARNEALQFRNDAEQFCNESKANRDATATIKSETAVLQGQAAQSAMAAEQHKVSASNSANAAAQSAASASRSEGIVTPLVPVVEKAAADAAKASEDAHKAVQDVKDLGAVPVGTIVMFGALPLPTGYISLMDDNPTFSISAYPELARLYPTGALPSYKDRVPEGIGSGITLGQHRAANVGLTTSISLTAQAVAGHSHSRGTMEIAGTIDSLWEPWHSPTSMNSSMSGAFYVGSRTGYPYRVGGSSDGNPRQVGRNIAFEASRGWSGVTSLEGEHGHSVAGSIGSGENKVAATGTIFAIKAFGAIANEGSLDASSLNTRLSSIETATSINRTPVVSECLIAGEGWIIADSECRVVVTPQGVVIKAIFRRASRGTPNKKLFMTKAGYSNNGYTPAHLYAGSHVMTYIDAVLDNSIPTEHQSLLPNAEWLMTTLILSKP
ncbi:tail fiber protein [Edwardsiella phage PVN09]|uniref:Tail fiber protein n=1 Tax=Edwardsiella phage PVN09 TaxID=2859518 RepID=A0AAE7VK78_9CAUD|nr:tail fiber protein [Edwardsiella phage PVN09]